MSAQASDMIKAHSTLIASMLILMGAPTAALAGDQETDQGEAIHRLSSQEMAEINATSEEPQIDAETLLGRNPDGLSVRRIQSEVAFGIGTNGYRELSASTLIPLGNDGYLGLGFSHVDDNLPRRYHYGRGPAF